MMFFFYVLHLHASMLLHNNINSVTVRFLTWLISFVMLCLQSIFHVDIVSGSWVTASLFYENLTGNPEVTDIIPSKQIYAQSQQ